MPYHTIITTLYTTQVLLTRSPCQLCETVEAHAQTEFYRGLTVMRDIPFLFTEKIVLNDLSQNMCHNSQLVLHVFQSRRRRL